jgi:ABC-type antimicrobial peptide transport system permease subunit
VVIAVSLALAAAIGLASSLIPALGAARTAIVEAIRDNG